MQDIDDLDARLLAEYKGLKRGDIIVNHNGTYAIVTDVEAIYVTSEHIKRHNYPGNPYNMQLGQLRYVRVSWKTRLNHELEHTSNRKGSSSFDSIVLVNDEYIKNIEYLYEERLNSLRKLVRDKT